VVIEFLCGARDSHELHLFRAFLDQLEVVDNGVVTQADLQKSQHTASRIPKDGKPRNLGDCLILAIASRLDYGILTSDLGLSGLK
jgi:predicted nucleic acid-binding protein